MGGGGKWGGGRGHPKRPRKKDFARWHHFSLIRQRLGGGPGGLKAETPGSEREGGSGAKVEKNKPPGTLIETHPPERGVKEAGQGAAETRAE